MFVQTVNQLSDLAPYQLRWDELAGDCPFRSWKWLSTWWKHYSEDRRLHVSLVFDSPCQAGLPAADKLVAILPAYLDSSPARGRVLHLLGDGEVCSEYLDLLCSPAHLDEASHQLADNLVTTADSWDSIQFTAVAENNRHLSLLANELASRGCEVDRSAGVNLWTIPLPESWDDFLAMQSKSHRKQLRQLKSRVLDSSRAQWYAAHDHATFDSTWEVLIDLHQRRRHSLGEPGCFASPAWANFHREIALELLSADTLRLSVLKLDDHSIAAEYHLADASTTYAYQGGIDPDRVADEPGQLSLMICIKNAIAAGHKSFELLRGDEPYKPHWRAIPTATANIEIISPRAVARWRHYSWKGLRGARRLAQQVAGMLS